MVLNKHKIYSNSQHECIFIISLALNKIPQTYKASIIYSPNLLIYIIKLTSVCSSLEHKNLLYIKSIQVFLTTIIIKD